MKCQILRWMVAIRIQNVFESNFRQKSVSTELTNDFSYDFAVIPMKESRIHMCVPFTKSVIHSDREKKIKIDRNFFLHIYWIMEKWWCHRHTEMTQAIKFVFTCVLQSLELHSVSVYYASLEPEILCVYCILSADWNCVVKLRFRAVNKFPFSIHCLWNKVVFWVLLLKRNIILCFPKSECIALIQKA